MEVRDPERLDLFFINRDMARLPRLYAPGVVQHVVQRPVEGRDLFIDADDYALFVSLLEGAVQAHALALHAYVLLPREIRLLATPADADSISRAMQAIGRRYVPHLNRKAVRSGSLWDRRYRSTLIDADAYLFASMRHIERRPVVDSLVAEPAEWKWSSYGHHVGDEQQTFISDHAHYWALSDTPFERQAAYRGIAAALVGSDLVERVDHAVERGWVLGDAAFIERLDPVLNRRPTPLPRGRKRKAA